MRYEFPLITFRPARTEDCQAIAALTQQADRGMTTVPRSREEVGRCLESTAAFLSGDRTAPVVLFAVENDGQLLGMSAIVTRLGFDRPFYSFRHMSFEHVSVAHGLSVETETLQLTTFFKGFTELATLFVPPSARGSGVAKLLSYGRLGFICAHRAAFSDNLMADIRGWTDIDGNSPFWAHLASKFIHMEFDEADRLSMQNGHFIAELLPQTPIHLNLLPKSVVKNIGRPNSGAVGALRMLEDQGFEHVGLCDVFDGGPSITCKTDATAISRSARKAVATEGASIATSALIWSGTGVSFRANMGVASFDNELAQIPENCLACFDDRTGLSAAALPSANRENR